MKEETMKGKMKGNGEFSSRRKAKGNNPNTKINIVSVVRII